MLYIHSTMYIAARLVLVYTLVQVYTCIYIYNTLWHGGFRVSLFISPAPRGKGDARTKNKPPTPVQPLSPRRAQHGLPPPRPSTRTTLPTALPTETRATTVTTRRRNPLLCWARLRKHPQHPQRIRGGRRELSQQLCEVSRWRSASAAAAIARVRQRRARARAPSALASTRLGPRPVPQHKSCARWSRPPPPPNP